MPQDWVVSFSDKTSGRQRNKLWRFHIRLIQSYATDGWWEKTFTSQVCVCVCRWRRSRQTAITGRKFFDSAHQWGQTQKMSRGGFYNFSLFFPFFFLFLRSFLDFFFLILSYPSVQEDCVVPSVRPGLFFPPFFFGGRTSSTKRTESFPLRRSLRRGRDPSTFLSHPPTTTFFISYLWFKYFLVVSRLFYLVGSSRNS